jgi:hypothetical protein
MWYRFRILWIFYSFKKDIGIDFPNCVKPKESSTTRISNCEFQEGKKNSNLWKGFFALFRSCLRVYKNFFTIVVNVECLSTLDFCMFFLFTLGEKLGFSTMVSNMFQLHFEVENVASNYKMFFSTQNDVFNCLPK